MSQCCSSSDTPRTYPKRHRCPVNSMQYVSVSPTTMLHHLLAPWAWQPVEQGYYFCDDPECDVVYFAQDDSTITRSSLRTKVGIKEKSDSSLICYCFGISKKDASNKSIKDFVIKSTKEQSCACATRNPSGRCCLKDFP